MALHSGSCIVLYFDVLISIFIIAFVIPPYRCHQIYIYISCISCTKNTLYIQLPVTLIGV